jgi:alginate O-acetyltransferase complex protein AlgJ
MRRSSALTTAFAVLAIAFFATPVALRAMGVTATAFENRRFAEAPKPSQGWDVFQQTTRFLTDRLPLRQEAVRANNSLWRTFFGTSPRYGTAAADGALPFAGQAAPAAAGKRKATPPPQVIEGRDGWLFLRGELERACTPLLDVRQALARWHELVSLVRTSGKRAVMVVPPDKGSIYGEHLPPGQLTQCGLRAKRRFWSLLARAPPSWGIQELERPLVRRKRRGGVPLYSKTDTHWTRFGSLTLVDSVLDLLGNGVRRLPSEVVRRGNVATVGDLTVLRGDKTIESKPRHTIRRASGAALVPGRTLIVYDSFGEAPLPLLKRYFRRLRQVPWVGPTDAQRAAAIAEADTVIFESTEREFGWRASEDGPVSRRFLRILRQRLRSE